MGRLMILNFLVLFLSSVGLLNCNTISERSISQSDIPDLIGKWEGYYNDGTYVKPVKLEILDESLRGKITFHGTYPTGTPQEPIPFDGKIENGRLIASWEKDRWMNLRLHKGGGKMKLECDYQWGQYKGTFPVEKIK